MERKLRDIYIEVHTFKAEAGSLNLTSVVSLAHELETSIQTVLAQPIVAGQIYLPPLCCWKTHLLH